MWRPPSRSQIYDPPVSPRRARGYLVSRAFARDAHEFARDAHEFARDGFVELEDGAGVHAVKGCSASSKATVLTDPGGPREILGEKRARSSLFV